ncbi:helix-hairpin-helix domain-containing protein [Chromobacterium haemolyticum]|uniref:helix-hairpin-helix domain-containing protein n=1 Tax=Chromobacterium haemolyticum TaxID=394935 RepID=UPI00307D655F
MHPLRCPPPARARHLRELPNIGPRLADDLRLLGIEQPSQLRGAEPLRLYHRLCELTGTRQDPCVLDTLMSVVHYMDTGEARLWWSFTAERKARGGY